MMESWEPTETQEGEQSLDPTSEPSSGDTLDRPDPSPSESTEQSPQGASSQSDQTADSSADSSDQQPETSSSESENSGEQPSASPPEADPSVPSGADSSSGLVAGTSSELQPGVGGTGDHPAPAVMRDPETGALHSAGSPRGWGEYEQSPSGDSTDRQDAGHALSPEAQATHDVVHEPEQFETDQPDIGTL